MIIYNSLQLREIFHLEFLRWLGQKIRAENYALKGGVNLRFFFHSFRYSEDMDLDIAGISVAALRGLVMKILQAPSFQDTLKPFGVDGIVPPDIRKAKQTETTQRFKIHLLTSNGEDLFTKIEFSRRGFKGEAIVELVENVILRAYKLSPLLVAHYDLQSAISQKIEALAGRSEVQARDVFDLYLLNSQIKSWEIKSGKGFHRSAGEKLTKAYNNIFEISFEQFRDTVVSYLSPENQAVYRQSTSWDEVKLKTAGFIEELRERNG